MRVNTLPPPVAGENENDQFNVENHPIVILHLLQWP